MLGLGLVGDLGREAVEHLPPPAWLSAPPAGSRRCTRVRSVSPPVARRSTVTSLGSTPVYGDRQVKRSRLGGSTSRYSPVCAISMPSPAITTVKLPPTRRSTVARATPTGVIHRAMRTGVQARKTASGGAGSRRRSPRGRSPSHRSRSFLAGGARRGRRDVAPRTGDSARASRPPARGARGRLSQWSRPRTSRRTRPACSSALMCFEMALRDTSRFCDTVTRGLGHRAADRGRSGGRDGRGRRRWRRARAGPDTNTQPSG